MPGRFSHYDTDEERLPDGMTRVGYDADTQVYTFQDADGSYWEGAPGCQYGQLTRVSGGGGGGAAAALSDLEYGGNGEDEDGDDSNAPFLKPSRHGQPVVSWRHDMRPLLNFGMLIGLFLLGLFWYLHWAAAEPAAGQKTPGTPDTGTLCEGEGDGPVAVRAGDTCWALAQARGIDVDDVLARNKGLDCDRLVVGSQLCLPVRS